MEQKTQTVSVNANGIPQLGAMARKKREQLERFDDERKRLQDKLRTEREELAWEVAEIEARAERVNDFAARGGTNLVCGVG